MGALDVINLFSGLGLFLYGMKVLGDGLEKAAGQRMQSIIEALTGNVFKGVLVGILSTALVQSSSAITVMAVGFVNAKVMTLYQAVGIILGSNIGTTVTAQILRLSDIQSTGILSFFKPDYLAPLSVAVGAVFLMFIRNKKYGDAGLIFMGFGVLFIGMDTMENSVSVLKDMPEVAAVFSAMGKIPAFGIATGAIVTAILQSSSASVGILQAVASGGFIDFAAAVPIILGQNIGTCITALISSIGTSKNARRTAIIHLAFNVIGVVVATIVIYSINEIFGIPGWHNTATRGSIADFHTLFNVAAVVIILPFNKILVKIACAVVGDDK